LNVRNDVPISKVDYDEATGKRPSDGHGGASPRRRADARRNERALLDAAAAVFVTSGVEAPVRDIAARVGAGVGTVYRHFPT
jgi:Bacterial regulatory proteins, tetR family